ncbi:hypothetical protein Y032_0086g1971 [Ancylostoma ceylanicum]|uniref:Uncharacterized protein n=1 Tax=Ancylostoma ceylanicum TaxID=53326 RepID=A0A016TQM1_9BILA|nr:hypothetical protein Y032_0086g1971 [Ancylostoma ceylanicum]
MKIILRVCIIVREKHCSALYLERAVGWSCAIGQWRELTNQGVCPRRSLQVLHSTPREKERIQAILIGALRPPVTPICSNLNGVSPTKLFYKLNN